jgi:hypothetical protein
VEQLKDLTAKMEEFRMAPIPRPGDLHKYRSLDSPGTRSHDEKDASNLHGFKRARWRGLIKQSIQDLLIAVVQNLRKLIAAIHNASENIYLALIDALISLLQAFTTLLTTDLPFHTRSTSSLAPVDSCQHPLSPGVRATARRNGE